MKKEIRKDVERGFARWGTLRPDKIVEIGGGDVHARSQQGDGNVSVFNDPVGACPEHLNACHPQEAVVPSGVAGQ